MDTFFTAPKIVALVFGAIVISKTLIDFRKKEEHWQMFLFWLLIWLGIIIVAFDPMLIDQIISHFGVGNYTIGQIASIGFVFIMFIVYRVYIKAHRIERQVNKLIRDMALKDVKKIGLTRKKDRIK
jgi:hypothetical protein